MTNKPQQIPTIGGAQIVDCLNISGQNMLVKPRAIRPNPIGVEILKSIQ